MIKAPGSGEQTRPLNQYKEAALKEAAEKKYQKHHVANFLLLRNFHHL